MWRSAIRNYKEVPQDSIGLRLSAQRLKNRKLKAAKMAVVDLKSSDTEDGLSEDENVDLDPVTGEKLKKEEVDNAEKMETKDDVDTDKAQKGDENDNASDNVKKDDPGDDTPKPNGSEPEMSMDVDNVVGECTVESSSKMDLENVSNECVVEPETEKMDTESEVNVTSSQDSQVKDKMEDVDVKQEVDTDVEKQAKKELPKCEVVLEELKPISQRDIRRQTATDNFLSYMKTKYVDNKNNVLVLDLLKKHPAKADVDLINVCESMSKRTYYPKVTKPYSKLDHLLDRRLKQEEVEKRQRMAIETQIALKTKLNKARIDQQRKKDEENELKESDKIDEATEKKEISSGPKWLNSCYSLACRSGDKGFYSGCYSPLCKAKNVAEQNRVTSPIPQATTDTETDSASSSIRSSKEGTPVESIEFPERKAELSADVKDENSLDETPGESKEVSPSESKEGTPLESVSREGTPSLAQPKSSNSSFQNAFMESLKSKGLDSSQSKDELKTGDDAGTEEEDVDIEGGVVDSKSGPLSVLKTVNDKSSASSTTSENSRDSISKGMSVSDIVKKKYIKTNLAQQAGKVPAVSAEALALSLEELEAKLPPKRCTSDKVKLPKFARFNAKKVKKEGKLPECHKFSTKSQKRKSVLVLERHELRKIARQGSKRESIMYNYNCKMNNVCWPYPCPRPTFKTAWRYRTMTLQSLSAAALQLRILWGCIR